jgi:polyketide synthase PksN
MTTQSHTKTFHENAYPLVDHRMNGRCVLPAAVYLEMGRALIAHAIRERGGDETSAIVLEQIRFDEPFLVHGSARLNAVIEESQAGLYELSFRSTEGAEELIHARMRGRIEEATGAIVEPALQLPFESFAQAQIYEMFDSVGMQYGNGFRSLVSAQVSTGSVRGVLRLPEQLAANAQGYVLHPSLFDGALQACALGHLATSQQRAPFVPTSIGRVRITGPLRGDATVIGHWVEDADTKRFDLSIVDPAGRCIVSADTVTGAVIGIRSSTQKNLNDGATLLFGVQRRRIADSDVGARHSRRPQASLLLACEDPVQVEAFLGCWHPNQDSVPAVLRASCSIEQLAASDQWRQWFRQSDRPLTLALLWPTGARKDATPNGSMHRLQTVFDLLQTVVSRTDGQQVHLVIASDHEDHADFGMAAPLAAMLRTIAAEHPEITATILSHRYGDARALGRAAAREALAVREGVRCIALEADVLHEDAVVDAHGQQCAEAFDTSRTALVTGGLGAIGRHLVDHLLRRGGRSIAIVGRTPLAQAQEEIQRRWPASVQAVSYHCADVADAIALRQVVEGVVNTSGPVGSVFHCAGIVQDGLFIRKRWEDFAAVVRPKMLGVQSLDEATADQPISRFVLFSSISSLFGNPGQSDYAFANGYLDAYASHRNAQARRGLRSGHAVSIHWGLWRDGGMQVSDSVERWLRETTGMQALGTAQALEALDTALSVDDERQVIVAGTATRVREFFAISKPVTIRSAEVTEAGQSTPQATTLTRVTQWVMQVVGSALKVEAASLSPQSDFESLGFDSFLVIQAARQLEKALGRISKSVFYEAKSLEQLAALLVQRYEAAVLRHLGSEEPTPVAAIATASSAMAINHRAAEVPISAVQIAPQLSRAQTAWTPVIAQVRDLDLADPSFAAWLAGVLRRWGDESSLAAAREDIAPYVFVAGASGVFFFNASQDTWLVFSYCGSDDTFGSDLDALTQFADARLVSLQVLLEGDRASAARARGYSTTKIGAMQVLPDIGGFSLAGGSMRRLRYLDDKFRKAGAVKVVELRAPLPDAERDAVLGLVDAWCAVKKRVNPYVMRVRQELSGGTLAPRHRLFACYLDDRMVNAVVITEIPERVGYLMDLEFYGADMPLGGLDCAIAAIVALLKNEGVRYFSLGATFGTLIGEAKGADADALAALQELHSAGILNNDGNFQFKNKFRTENRSIFICRSPKADAGSIADALLLFGDPGVGALDDSMMSATSALSAFAPNASRQADRIHRGETTSDLGCPALIDLRTDSWAELDQAFIDADALALNAGRDDVGVEERVRHWFPFDHIFLAAQGRQAEALFYKALAALPVGAGTVIQNVLFPTQVYHQLDNGFEPLEVGPSAQTWSVATDFFAQDLEPGRFDQLLEGRAPVLVMFELACNAGAGRPSRLSHLRALRAWCDARSVPLFLDATRVVDNAVLIQRQEAGYADRSVQEIVAEICSLADGVTASLSKDFCATDGALVACRDPRLAAEISRVTKMHGAGLSQRQRARLAAALGRLKEVERRVVLRIDQAAALAQALRAAGAPVLAAGAHCVLLAVPEAPLAAGSGDAASHAGWLQREAGVQAAAHLASAVHRADPSRWVRLAVPVGMPHSWIDEAARRLIAAMGASASASPSPLASMALPTATSQSTAHPAGDIAIVGLAIRCAGAEDASSFWRLLCDGTHAISEVPFERWNFREELDARGRPTTRWGGFLRDVDAFDSLFFKISPREAELMDPQERLFLQTAWAALEDAGYSPEELRRTTSGRVGVFVGSVWSLYHTIGHEEVLKGNPVAPNSFHWSIANRVSYSLDITGPSMAVDTACSSSLTALHLACAAIERGECDAAIVGGVNLELHPSKPRVTNVGGVLSERGRCAAFGDGADGYVPGEGVGALIVKPLRKALADRDQVYGVVKATQINHGGRTNGYAVPSPTGQAALVAGALERGRVDARSVSYIEAHGTGTELGDPIEISGLADAFGQSTHDRQFCAIGSVKSNIGHLEAAAGVAGVVKVLLQLKHRMLVPTLHAARHNQGIEFDQTPFVLQQTLAPWHLDAAQQQHPRRAGVSSFGAGGANAHVLLEEHVHAHRKGIQASTETVLLSARTAPQLAQKARDLRAFLREPETASVRLADLAFTLAVGRADLDHRLAINAADIQTLSSLLERFQANPADRVEGIRVGVRKKKPEAADANAGDPVARWVDGQEFDWHEFFKDRPVQRISLPTYPFERTPHWVGATSPSSRALAVSKPLHRVAAHPLLDDARDPSDRLKQAKRLRADEFVVSDHLVAGHHTLPGVSYIEMALAAARRAGTLPAAVRMSNVTWLQPIMLPNGELDVAVHLQDKTDRLAVVISTGQSATSTVHAQCVIHLEAADISGLDTRSIEERRQRLTQTKSRDLLYRTLRAMGMEHRGAFQVLGDLHHDEREGLVAMNLPAPLHADHGRYDLHPSLMDGALQAAAVLVTDIADCTGTPDIPFVVKEVLILRSPPPSCYAQVRLVEGATKGVRRFDIDIVDEVGAPCVAIRGFSVRTFKGDKRAAQKAVMAHDVHFYADAWLPPTPLPAVIAAHPVLVIESCAAASDNLTALQDAPSVPELIHYHIGEAEVAASGPRLQFEHVRRLGQLLDALPKLGAGRRRTVVVSYPMNDMASAALVAAVRSMVQETSRVRALTLGLAPGLGLPDATPAARHIAALEDRVPGTQEWTLDGGLRAMCRSDVTHDIARDEIGAACFAQGKSYLITGGTGGVARILAMHLARVYQARITLIGRRERDGEIEGWLETLRRSGGQVIYVSADVCDETQLAHAVAQARSEHGSLHGILHCAGTTDDKLLRHKSLSEMESIAATKVAGVEHLDAATACDPLELFVVFSSIASATGNIGQTDYAAANRYLDLFCAERAKTRGGRSLSIRWPLWSDGGMQVDDATWHGVQRRTGLRKLGSDEALACLDQALRSGHVVLGVAAGEQEKLSAWLGLDSAAPCASPSRAGDELASQAPGGSATTQEAQEESHLMRDDVAAVLQWVRNEVCQVVARLLKLKASDLDPSRDMSDYGIDSVMLTEFTNELNTRFGLELTPVAFFEYPDIDGLARFMVDEHPAELAKLVPAPVSAPTAAPRTPVPASASAKAAAIQPVAPKTGRRPVALTDLESKRSSLQDEPIAVIGMHGVLPGAADLGEFWRKLMLRENMLSEVPADRFDWRKFVGDPLREINRISSKWGGFIDDIDKFDPLFFKLSPVEATFMDPQQRVFLETVWHTIEDAGYKPSALSGTRTGIFVGLATNDYIELLHATYPQVETYLTTGNAHSVLPNRISYLLDLRGPSEPVDTACSSSLVAIHRAVQSIRTGECDLAVAGGVGLMITPTTFISFSRAGMLSPDGRCKTFDKDANGYVRGEGSAAILLKPLSKAERDGDHIYAVIRGSAVNHGGSASSLTAPNPHAQAEVVLDAYRKAGVDADAVGYIEAHGTGTPLGDPVEIAGLKKAFKSLRAEQGKASPAREGQCAIGSVKSNIGHLEAAAGIAGVVKVLLALRHKTLPATEHVSTLNPYIDFSGSPFALAMQVRPWEQPRGLDGTSLPRCAGVSSFGFGGVNAHIVLEEHTYAPADEIESAAPPPQLFVLSAKTPDALRSYAERLAFSLRDNLQGTPLVDIAYTLQVGRDAFKYRLAFMARDTEHAASLCEAFLSGVDEPCLFHFSASTDDSLIRLLAKSRAAQGFLSSLADEGELETLAQLWVSGVDVDFGCVHAAPRRRVPLPGYPFARERYWIPYEDITEAMAGQSVYSRLGHRSFTAATTSEPLPQPSERVATVRHPMLDVTCPADAANTFASYQKIFRGDEFYFAHHRLNGDALMPAAGYVELAMAAATALHPGRRGALQVLDVAWRRPLRCALDASDKVVRLDLAGSPDAFDFAIRDGAMAPEMESGQYSSGRVRLLNDEQAQRLLVEASSGSSRDSEESCTVVRDMAAIYNAFDGIGLHYGESFRSVVRLSGNDEEAHGTVELPLCAGDEFDAYVLHPSLIDGALQCIDGLTVDGGFDPDRLSVPYALESLTLFSPLPRKLLVHAMLRPSVVGSGVKVFDIRLRDVGHTLVGLLRGFSVRAIRRSDAMSTSTRSDGGMTPGKAVAQQVHPAQTATSVYASAPAQSPMLLQEMAQARLVQLVAQALKLPETRIGLDTPFDQFGIDSLSISRLSESLERVFGQLPKTLFFEYGNLRTLAEYFARHHAVALASASAPAPAPAPASASASASASAARPVEPVTLPPLAQASRIGDLAVDESAERRVMRLVAEALKLPLERLDPDAGFDRYGIDSLAISRLTERLEAAFGTLPKTLFFEHANLRQLCAYLVRRSASPAKTASEASRDVACAFKGAATAVNAVSPRQESPPADIAATPTVRSEDIAVIGVSGRYPQADDLDEFWAHLRSGRDCIETIPPSRWEPPTNASDRRRHGGFLRNVDSFDSLFFNISPREARSMDPNERLFLETAWSAVEDAGYRAEDLGQQTAADGQASNSVGVFVGVMWGQYAHYGVEQWLGGSHALATSTYWSIANRVSYVMNFQGPSMAIDTACSSSLTAIHMACESLRRGECKAAVAGGVNLTIHPIKHHDLASAGFLSLDGRCRSFGEGGDGYVPGEGVGAVVLKRLVDAVRDGDHVHAVLRGSSVNHGGRTNGFSVPSPVAQGRLIEAAIQRAGVSPDTIGYVEAHGTGTSLGDPIEIVGLTRAFNAADVRLPGCLVGSVKSNIGHLEAAAGIAALTKVILQMRHGEIVPSLHSARLNPYIDFSGAPFQVPQELRSWLRTRGDTGGGAELPRRAGISSFGAGGSNAHVVVEEYLDREAQPSGTPSSRTELFVFSARKEDALRQCVERFVGYLHATVPDGARPTPDRIAHTLQTGRKACEHRLAIIASSHAALEQQLNAYLAHGADGERRFHGIVEDDTATGTGSVSADSLPEAAKAWVAGASIRWDVLRPGPAPRRAPLPTYPFQRRRHWIGGGSDRLHANPAQETQAPGETPQSATSAVAARDEANLFACVPVWRPHALGPHALVADEDVWLLLIDEAALEQAFRTTLARLKIGNDRLVVVRSSESSASVGDRALQAQPGDFDSFAQLMAALGKQGRIPTRIVHCWSLRAQALSPDGGAREGLEGIANAQAMGVQTLFALTRAWLKQGMPENATLIQASIASEPDGVVDAMHHASIGFARGIEREDPRMRARLVSFDAAAELGEICDRLVEESLARAPQECHVRYQRRDRLVERHEASEIVTASLRSSSMSAGGVVLITGAFGGIGRLLAEHWAASDRTLVLIGRRPIAGEALEWTERLHKRCLQLIHEAVDCSDVHAMEDLVVRLRARVGRITGVVHAAGVLRDGYVFNKASEDFARVLAPKVAGTVALDYATRDEPLAFFLMLSSMVAAVGNEAQSDYCSANAFIDGFALQRSAWVDAGLRRGTTVAIGLPLWRNAGMQIGGDLAARLRDRYGMVPLESRTGLQLLDGASGVARPRVLVMSGDAERLKHSFDVLESVPEERPDLGAPSSELPGPATTARRWWLSIDGRAGSLNPSTLSIARASDLCAVIREGHGVALQVSQLAHCTSPDDLEALVRTQRPPRSPEHTGPTRRARVESLLDQLDRKEIDPAAAAAELAVCDA